MDDWTVNLDRLGRLCSLLSDGAVTSRIFERGLDFFGEEIDCVLCYLTEQLQVGSLKEDLISLARR